MAAGVATCAGATVAPATAVKVDDASVRSLLVFVAVTVTVWVPGLNARVVRKPARSARLPTINWTSALEPSMETTMLSVRMELSLVMNPETSTSWFAGAVEPLAGVRSLMEIALVGAA